jgi:uncharacterized membrane protein
MILGYAGTAFMITAVIVSLVFPGFVPFEDGELVKTAVSTGILLAVIAIFYIISVPYIYGGIWYSETAVTTRNEPTAALFGCYNDSARVISALKTELALFAKKAPVFIPLVIVSAGEIFMTSIILNITDGFFSGAAVVGCVLSVFGLYMLYKVYALRFFPARYIFAENPELPAGEIIKRSLTLTKGKVNFVAGVFLRLLPLYISCLLVLPLTFVPPVCVSAYALIFRELRKNTPSE